MINQLCTIAYKTAKDKGFHDEEYPNTHWLAMIHSEVSEALEADRKGDVENFAEELADICIRTFDLAGLRGIDLEKVLLAKMKQNQDRPYKHDKKY